MKNLLYIGNQLSQTDKTSTTIDTLSQLLRDEGYSVITASKKSNKFFRLLDMLLHIIKFRKRIDYVLIDTYSTQNFYYAYFCSQLCKFYKLKYIPILHGGNLQNRLKNNFKLSKAIFNDAFKNVSPSEYLKSAFQKFDFLNLEVIPNSLELQDYSFKERVFNEPMLLWVRSFSKIYNPSLAIKLLKALKDESINASLCMVGPDNDGTMIKAKDLAKKLNVHVTFTGKLSKQEWIDLSKDYNLFINTTNFDNMPVSVIEAMALGLPVISTNVGGIPFLIKDKEDGILIEPNDVDLFVDAVKKAIDNPNKANERALKAREKVEQFDWDVVKLKWIELLQ